jgi:hypothetical protein
MLGLIFLAKLKLNIAELRFTLEANFHAARDIKVFLYKAYSFLYKLMCKI